MEAKKAFMLIFGMTEDQAEQLITKTGKIGFAVPGMVEKFFNDITVEDPDDPERADLAKKWFERLSVKHREPSFLSYLHTLSNGDFRAFVDCLIFLKRKQDEIEKIDTIFQSLMKDPIEALDEVLLSELKRICGCYGIEVDEENKDAIKACLEEEKRNIKADMYVADLGFEPDNLYSAVDVIKHQFDFYCKAYGMDNADINVEMKKVLDWLEENEKQFQPID